MEEMIIKLCVYLSSVFFSPDSSSSSNVKGLRDSCSDVIVVRDYKGPGMESRKKKYAASKRFVFGRIPLFYPSLLFAFLLSFTAFCIHIQGIFEAIVIIPFFLFPSFNLYDPNNVHCSMCIAMKWSEWKEREREREY